ncbi:MAG: hypothetical protein LBV04_04780 [Deferribacteraceae bacterium]|jgi:two-component SAPR family response regulator|nr:hypothetical protein [Deferribacteraceae bacterium]
MAYLLCQNNATTTKARIAEALWPETELIQALNNLYKLCNHLKDPKNERLPIIVHRNEISLDGAMYSCDLKDFDLFYAEKTIASYEQAIRLYYGPAFSEDNYWWTSEYEAKYDIEYYQILDFLIKAYEQKNPQLSKYYKKLYDKML